jgi:hypothetical protein
VTEGGQTTCLCHRCGAELTPGEGNFYVVRIEAVADPTPPNISQEDLQGDLDSKIESLLRQTRGMSERELMDQVYRRLTLCLCARCYADWIENPAG